MNWTSNSDEIERRALEGRLETLREEHRALDTAIGELQMGAAFDQLAVQRLKRRKLVLRDEINRLEDALTPDIIA